MFVFYDLETTGTDEAFDQILQFGGLKTNDDLDVIGDVAFECRRLPHIVPTPGAMVVTGMSPDRLESPSTSSHYELIRELKDWLTDEEPIVFSGYNILDFDEKFLRQAFYQTLHDPYLTTSNFGTRFDVLQLVRAVTLYTPRALVIPENHQGKPTLKLDQLAPANGFPFDRYGYDAHDARADVRATVDIARLIRDRAPDVWRMMSENSRKADVEALLKSGEPLVATFFYFGRPYNYLVAKCGVQENSATTFGLFDLTHDPAPLLDARVDEIRERIEGKPKVIRTLRSNQQPILTRYDPNNPAHQTFDVDPDDASERAEQIAADAAFQARVGSALAERYADQEEPAEVERQIYSGGFSSSHDRELMRRFHEVDWSDRWALCDRFQDARFAEIGKRLIFIERREHVPGAERARMEAWIRDRVLAEDGVPWNTIGKARNDLVDLRRQRGSEDSAALDLIEAYLDDLTDLSVS